MRKPIPFRPYGNDKNYRQWMLLLVLFVINSTIGTAQNILTSRVVGNWDVNTTWMTENLNGTISVQKKSNVVTGTGTDFTTLTAGDPLYKPDGSLIGTIALIGSPTSLILTVTATSSFTTLYRTGKIPTASDKVIVYDQTVTIPASYVASCTSLEVGFLGAEGKAVLVFAGTGSSLTTAGNVTVFGNNYSNTGAVVTRAIEVVGGTMVINGNLEIGKGIQTNPSTKKRNKISLTTGSITLLGNLIFNSSEVSQAEIVLGSGTFNLAGNFFFNYNLGKITPDTGTFNFNSTTANQLIPTGFSGVVFSNLNINTANPYVATLFSDITAVNVTGNIAIGNSSPSSSLNNGGFAITLASGKNFSLADGSLFRLSGTSTMALVSGGGTNTFGANSNVDYNGSLQTVSGETYGNLILSNNNVINSGVKTLAASAIVAGGLTVIDNASFVVNSNINLTVGSSINVTSPAIITIHNNANLIQTSAAANTGNIIVRRDSNPLSRLDYTMWSAPVSGQLLQPFSPQTLSNRFYIYNSVTNAYNIIDPATTNFAIGTGYLIRMPNNAVDAPATQVFNGQFTGTPNNGNVSIPVTSGTYNAVGNPYPSTLNADLFMSGNGITSNTDALYFWRKSNNAATTSYATYTTAGGTANSGDPNGIIPNGIIQVGQGFIAKATNSTLVFNNSMRVANNANQFLKTSENKSRIWLNLSNGTTPVNQMMIAYMSGATSGIDTSIDGLYINDSQTALTSIINSSEFVIQGRALPFEAADAVQLGFKTTIAGTFVIAIDHVDGLFATGQNVYLKDNLTNTIHNLSESAYAFSTAVGIFNTRFEMVYQTTTLGTNNSVFNENNVVVYQKEKALFIDSAIELLNNVKVYDITGRLLIEENNINASQVKLYPNATNEVLIVKITTQDNHIITKKVVQ